MTKEVDSERYGLQWVGRAEALRAAIDPPSGALIPDRACSLEWEEANHVIVEGDNLEVLRILQRSYFGAVQLIFIDPPYNTGGSFLYRDNYRDPIGEYLRFSEQVDEEQRRLTTNTDLSGRFHSRWLTMMYPRLALARSLLAESGFLVVTIDDHEVHNLRILLDELFGPENFVANVVWQKTYTANMTARLISNTHDHVLIYAKMAEKASFGRIPRTPAQLAAFKNWDDDPKGPWKAENLSAGRYYAAGQFTISTPAGRTVAPPQGRYWRCNELQYDTWLAQGRIWFGKKGGGRPMLKRYLCESKEGLTPGTWWPHDECGSNKEASLELKKLFDGEMVFDTPKPVRLLRRILHLCAPSGSLILDFFAGSGTTAHAVLDANEEDEGQRRFLLVQLPVPTGRGLISELCIERVRRAGRGKVDAGFRVFRLGRGPSDDDEAMLVEMLLWGGFPLDTRLVRHDLAAGALFEADFQGRSALLALDKIDDATGRWMLRRDADLVLLRDNVFKGNDALKVNLSHQLAAAGVAMRVL
ncbi:MAG: site-specific DNA-methyltransferase [Proteobacteria bacterium]|nr:site-specific DNA-methyltransferase [Pseudomonadota bacterium]